MHGSYNSSADLYYEIRDDGYYAPQLYEGFAFKPLLEVAASIDFDFDLTILGGYKLKGHHKLYLARWNGGLQLFTSSKSLLGSGCLQLFFRTTLLGLAHDLRTSVL